MADSIPDWMDEALKNGYNKMGNYRDEEKKAIINLCEIIYAGGYTDIKELKYKFYFFLNEVVPQLVNNYPLYLIWLKEWHKGKTNG